MAARVAAVAPHAATEHPQLLDHRPHRPRQDDALRPPDGAHRGAHPAGDDRAVPRLDGPRARARHHDQAALGAPRLQGEGRRGLRPQPDRHARPRGLRLRGLALARRLPGGAAGGGREPGGRGADARQRPPRRRRRARDHPGPQQDRPAGRRAGARRRADRAGHRHRRLGRDPRPRPSMGIGIDEILEAIVHRIPPPKGDPDGPLRGARLRLLVRPVPRRRDPGARGGRPARAGHEGAPDGDAAAAHEVEQLGVFTPKPVPVDSLCGGRGGLRDRRHQEGVRRRHRRHPDRRPQARRAEPLPGFKEIKPMVFAGLYPVDADQYAELRDALEKLRLNDSSFFYEPETSTALGFGFRCGFLGPAAHGDRPGAPRARVQPRAARHRALGALPGAEDGRRGGRGGLAGAAARARARSRRSRSRSSPPPS